MKGKTLLLSLGVVAVLCIAAYLIVNRPTPENRSFKVGLVFLLQHPAIDQGIDGFKTELQRIEAETGAKFEVTYSNAFGEPKNVNGIIASFQQHNVDAIVALTTPCAQIAKKMVTDKPVIFVGISDPIGAGLVKSLDSGLDNVTGTTSQDPNFETLELAKRLFPSMKKVGIVYTSSEANSVSILNNLDERIKSKNLDVQIVRKPISTTTEILPAARVLLSEVDAMFLINDNAVVSSVDLLVRESTKSTKPIFASDVDSVKKGALFTYGLNYKDEGTASADILKAILMDKTSPSQVPVYVNNQYYLYVNNQLFKYPIDTSLVSGADIVGK
jgi:putative tryptophan/tyrosine transport system substrate-binding protein